MSLLFILIGMVAFWVLGLLGFFVLPLLSSLTETVKLPARLAGSLAMRVVGRAAFVVSEHDEIVFKRMEYKDIGVERITFGAEAKDFDDPWAALSHWKGFPFALADEVTGTLFDPRHAAFGAAFRDAVESGVVDTSASPDDVEQFDVTSWGPGVLELPGSYSLVDLSGVRALVDGGERAEFPQRVEKLYEFTREPFGDDNPSMRIFLPIGALILCVAAMWFFGTQMTGGSGGGGGGGSGTTLSPFMIGALGLAGVGREDLKRAAIPLCVVLFAIGVFAMLVALVGPILAVLLAFSLVCGFVFVPAIALGTMWLGPVSGLFGDLFLRMFLLGYSRPVWVWSPTGYDVVEHSTLPETAEVNWYRLKGQLVGFGFEPEGSSFGPEHLEPSKVKAMQGVEDASAASTPAGWSPAESLLVPPYGGLVPSNVSASSVYVDVRTIVRRLSGAATGDKTLQRLLLAKEKHGVVNRSIGDQALAAWTVGCGVFGLLFGWLVFV